jgi:putative two-component system response regulator
MVFTSTVPHRISNTQLFLPMLPQSILLPVPAQILVADDEPSICQFVHTVLTLSGYEVETVENGREAWAELGARSYDLLITDCEMPMLNGMELVRLMRGGHFTTPVLLISGLLPPDSADLRWLLTPGDTLEKPFLGSVLQQQVAELLADRTIPQPHRQSSWVRAGANLE